MACLRHYLKDTVGFKPTRHELYRLQADVLAIAPPSQHKKPALAYSTCAAVDARDTDASIASSAPLQFPSVLSLIFFSGLIFYSLRAVQMQLSLHS